MKKFFDSVKDRYPHFEFLHCWGLGVLVVGSEAPTAVLELVDDVALAGIRRILRGEGRPRVEAIRGDGRGASRAHTLWRYASAAQPSPAPPQWRRALGTIQRILARCPDRCSKRVKLLAFYFPQFHAIPENDEWWGKGFTDWVNVRKAQPQFRGHYQPRVPLGERYYDQSEKATIEWQIDMARSHGLHGFCHYHYWFDGKQLLQTPTNIVIESKELDFPFCLAWANETWSRRWDGRDHHILQEQTHRPDTAIWQAHFEYLFRAWSDDRAIKVDGKPMFLIYRAHRIHEIGEMFDFWRELAHRRGLPGLYFVAIKQYEFPIPEVLKHFDAIVQFQPFEALYSPDFEMPLPTIQRGRAVQLARRLLPEKAQDLLRAVRYNLFEGLTFYDYDRGVEAHPQGRARSGHPGVSRRVRRLGQHGPLQEARAPLPRRLSRALRILVPPARAGDGATPRARALHLPQCVERVGRRHVPRARRALRLQVSRGGATQPRGRSRRGSGIRAAAQGGAGRYRRLISVTPA